MGRKDYKRELNTMSLLFQEIINLLSMDCGLLGYHLV
jgi:hypothetical protein